MNANRNGNHNYNPGLESVGRQRGFSLIEIMVALTLSLFLITGMIQLLIGNKQSYRIHEAQSRMQENGRFSLEVLNRSIRMAEFTSCPISKTFDNLLLNNTTTWWENFGAGSLVGYDGTDTQIFPGKAFGTGSADRVKGTDAITIIGGGGQTYSIVSHNPTLATFTLTSLGVTALKKGNIVISCNPADRMQVSIFQVKSVTGNSNDSLTAGKSMTLMLNRLH